MREVWGRSSAPAVALLAGDCQKISSATKGSSSGPPVRDGPGDRLLPVNPRQVKEYYRPPHGEIEGGGSSPRRTRSCRRRSGPPSPGEDRHPAPLSNPAPRIRRRCRSGCRRCSRRGEERRDHRVLLLPATADREEVDALWATHAMCLGCRGVRRPSRAERRHLGGTSLPHSPGRSCADTRCGSRR
jgi:hypothetical protein